MKIIIKQKVPKIKKVSEEEKTIEKDYFDVFFDVETDKEQYADPDNQGYFPIEIEDKGQTDEELKQQCLDWINKHNILSIYKPTYKTKRDLDLKKKKEEILERQATEELDKAK
jgi:hypothetical protein